MTKPVKDKTKLNIIKEDGVYIYENKDNTNYRISYNVEDLIEALIRKGVINKNDL